MFFFSVKDLVEEVNIIFQTFYVKDFVEEVNIIFQTFFFEGFCGGGCDQGELWVLGPGAKCERKHWSGLFLVHDQGDDGDDDDDQGDDNIENVVFMTFRKTPISIFSFDVWALKGYINVTGFGWNPR